jgi:hypothetical protein
MSSRARTSFLRSPIWLATIAVTACGTEAEPTPEVEDRAGVAPTCEPVDLDPRRAIFETNLEVLAPFTMRTVLRRAAENAGYAPTPVATYRRIIDTYATAEEGRFPNGQHCDDEAPDPAFTDPDGCGLLGCEQRFFCAAHDELCFSCNGEGTVCLDPGFPSGSHQVCSFDGSGEICTFDGDIISDCQPVVGDECDDAGCHPLGCDAVSLCDPTFELCVVCTAELDQCEVTQGTPDEAVELVCNSTDMCELDVATGTVSGCEPDPVCEEAQCGPLGCDTHFLCTDDFELCFFCSDDGQVCELFGQEVPSPSQVCNFDTGEVCTFEQGTVSQCGPDTEEICFGGGGDTGGFDSGGFVSGGESDGGGGFISVGGTEGGGSGGFDSGGFDSGGFIGDGGEVTGSVSITATSDGGDFDEGGTSFGESDGGVGDDAGGPGFGAINGYPLECPRIEANQIDNIDAWFPISISNRFDLAPDDGAHCGQQRIVFANNAQGRMFMIFEAQIPNPYPECGLEACRPIVDFWANMNEIENPKKRRKELVRAFLEGHPYLESRGFGPFVNADHYAFGTGQVRTNNFDDFPWTLREFKLHGHTAPGQPPKVRAVQVPVSYSPIGDHFNDALDTPLGPECRESFLVAMEGLLTDEPNAMSFPIAPECRAAESRDDFVSDFALQLQIGSGAFEAEIDARLLELGSSLTAEDIANRARFAGACIGCHEQSNGADLGGGVIAPFSAGFTHTAEFDIQPCGNGQVCFGISDALESSFLPHRKQVMEDFLAQTPCGDLVCTEPQQIQPLLPADVPQVLLPGGEVNIDAMLQLERRSRERGAARTVGGQSTMATH